MATINRVTLMGHLGKDAEVVQSKTGKNFLKLSVATNEKRGTETQTDWHSVALFGEVGNRLANVLKKGDQVFLEGTLKYSQTGDGADRRYFTQIQTFHVAKVSRSQDAQQGAAAQQRQSQAPLPPSAPLIQDAPPLYPPTAMDDIPF